MISITEARNKLPSDFIDKLYENFTDGVVDSIIRGICAKRYQTIRVNTIKCDIQSLMSYFRKINIKFERVLWYKDALIIKNKTEQELQSLDIYEKGYFYMQSLSSMVPPLVLNPKSGERILDLTAAPGSKTTQIACLMNNNGYILANELDKIRCERLKYNVLVQGATIIDVNNGRGEYIGRNNIEKFDKVLLDTPCSGEGRFDIKNVQSYKNWSKKNINELVKMQKKLLKSAYEALKPGGILVYSTCTLNKEENENIVLWAISNFNLKLQDITLTDIKNSYKGFRVNNVFELEKTLRIVPSDYMEGFYIAKFKKL